MKTAIYLRQSLDRDMEKVSVDYQRTRLHALCEENGWDSPVEYLDRNVSATTGRREAYEDMCEDIRNGVIGRVAVWDMDRLHRQPVELEDFIALAEKHHVDLANVGGKIDLSTPSGKLFARMKGTVAKYEVEQKSARQKAANEERAKRGKAWNVRVFGYDGDELVPAEAEAIREASAAIINGASLWGIAKAWNEAGLTTAKGGTTSRSGKVYEGTWSGGTVKQVLVRPRNAGLQVYDGEIVEGVETAWPAIVSRDTLDAVRAVLADPSRMTGKKRSLVHLLSGLAFCGLCGRKMGTTSRRRKSGNGHRNVYQCKNTGCMRVVRDLGRTDEVVVRAVTARLARPDAAVIFARPSVDTAALNEQANTYRALIAAAQTEYDEGIVTGADLKRRRDTLTPKLDAIEAKLLGSNTSRKLDGLVGMADAADRFDGLSLDRKRAVIDAVCTVTVEPTQSPGESFNPRRIRVEWKADE